MSGALVAHVGVGGSLYLSSSCVVARRDKYEKGLKEYWVNTKTRGVFETENGETINKTTVVEGEAGDFRINGIGEDELPMDDVDEQKETSDEEDEDESDGKSSVSRRRENKKSGLEEEEALEASRFQISQLLYCSSIWWNRLDAS